MKSFCHLALLTAFASACSSGPVRRTYQPEGSGLNSGSAQANPGYAATQKAEGIKKAQIEYSNGNYLASLEILDNMNAAVLKAGPRTEYWNLKGLSELASKNPAAAEISFRGALASNPNPEFAGYYLYNLASAYADEHKSPEALTTLNKIDLTKMESPDLRKIQMLKEKLARGETGSLMNNFATTTPTPSAEASPTATPARPVYSGPVNAKRIGLLLPLSGKYEAFGKKVQRAVELAFQNSPVVKNQEIELVPIDSGDTAASHQDALHKLIEEHQVIAVIGPILSKGVDALAERSDYYQSPIISMAQVQGPSSSFLYSCSISNEDQAAKMVQYAMDARGLKRFAILAPSNKPGEEMAQAFWDQVAAHGGSVKAYELYDPDLKDFREPVDKAVGLFYKETRAKEIKELADKREELKITKKTMKTIQYFELPPIVEFDAVFIADEAKTVGQIIPTFAYRNAKDLTYLGISSWNSPQLVTRAAEQAEGATFPVAFNTINPPNESKRFYDLYNATYSNPPGELDAVAYDTATAVLDVMKDRPSSRQEFSSKFSALTRVEGATGLIDVKNHHCARNLAIFQVKKGEFQVVR